jgi:hypothetical protein
MMTADHADDRPADCLTLGKQHVQDIKFPVLTSYPEQITCAVCGRLFSYHDGEQRTRPVGGLLP